MSNPIEQAAVIPLIAVLQALKQFNNDLGPDPTKWALTLPGANLRLMGTLGLQLPVLAGAEVAAVQGLLNTQVDTWISKLQAAQTANTVTVASGAAVK